ncbi:MAG: DUF2341 domain-containing protein, partial [Chitinispirillaceae bacterium]|nr:DUF2341 domain-containing protein [Chitinispirillaceae bacterium]
LAITASGGGANLSQLKFTLTGTYATSDITKILVKFNSSSDYASSYTASSDLTTIASSGDLNTISLFTPYVSGTSYLWIIADISSSAAGRTMTVSAISSSNLTFSAGTCTGTSYASGQFTLGTSAVSEDYSSWSYSKTFTLNTTITGANVSSNNVNFPVLLRLNPGNFSYFSQTLTSGADIRFSKSNGVPLRYTIERWVDNTGDNDTAEIWVKIDTVYGNNSTQSFKMYWGKSGAVDSSKSAMVFDTSNGFIAAYYLDQSSGAAVDYTSNALNGTANGNVPRRQAGMVGYGQSFDGDGDYFNAGSGSKFDVSADDKVTIMAWVKPAGNAVFGTIEGIATKWRWNGTTAYQYALAEDQYNGFFFALSGSGTDYTFIYDSVGDPPNNGIWYHLVGQMDASKMRLFVNGTARDSATQTAIAPENSNAQFKIGMTDDDGAWNRQFFNGVIDFVTLSKTARSPDWIKLCYENQKADQVLVDPENYSTWSYSSKITINTSGITTTDCYKFPLLIRLTKANFNFSQAQSAGQDIRFEKSNGQPFPYQIEQWDNSNGNAEIWVKIDTVFGNDATQYITMYWGKSGVSSKSDGMTVFEKENRHAGVWHFGESSGSLYDATSYSYTCTRNGNMAQTTGTIGYGQTFDGSGDYAELGDYLNLGYNNFTVSAWVKRGSTGTHTIAGKTNGGGPSSLYGWCFTFDLNGYLYFYTASGGSAWGDAGSFWLRSSSTLTDNTAWHYVTAVINKSSNSLCKIYIDGADKSGTTTGSITDVGSIANTLNTRIGSESAGGSQFQGSLDEVRTSFSARSSDWIKLCYENQKNNQTISNISANYSWDKSSAAGVTTGDGTWGTDSYWTVDSVTLIPWPGAGNGAIFAGIDGTYTITVSGTQDVDSITFLNSGYTLSGGILNFGTKNGIYLESGKTAIISSVISGNGGLSIRSTTTRATLDLNGSNTYTGATTIDSFTCLNVSSLADGGIASPLGASGSTAENLVIDGGQLQLSSGTSSTDRLFTVTQNGACIYSSGDDAMDFINTGSLAFSGSGARIIEFGGSHGGSNTFAPAISDGSGGATSILKTGGTSTWIFSGNNTFTGSVAITTGILRAGSSNAFGNESNAITVSNTGAIDVNGYNLQSYTGITINGTLLSTYGALYNKGAEQQYAFSQISLGSNASIGNDGNRFDIGRGYTGNRIFGNGYTLTKVGTGTIAFAADATNLGGLVVNGGAVILETNASAGSAPITIGASGTLSSNGSRTFTNQITFNSGGTITTPNNASYTTTYNGTVAVSGTVTLNTVTTNSLTLGGVISGTGTINKSGSGTVILSGTNTYNGTINVNEGSLRVTGSTTSGSTVAVASGATLSGTGNVQGTVTISNSGIVAPGITGAGVLSTGALTLNSSSILNYDLGSISDTTKVNGDLTLDGTLNITFTGTPGTYTLMTYTGNLTNNSLSLGTVPSGYIYAITATNGNVTLDIQTRDVLPITVNHNIGTGTSDTCLVYTDKWSLIFDEDDGGQIKFLSDQPDAAGVNQIPTSIQRNIFSIEYGQRSYEISGTLKITEITPVSISIENTYTLSSITFTEEYTVDGAGRIYLKVRADNLSGSDQIQQLSFLSFRDDVGSAVRITETATASSCSYVLNAESSEDQFDIILALYDLWSDATGFIDAADDYSCIGYTDNSFLFVNNSRNLWEFMIDFYSKNSNDTSAITNHICDDYRTPDSLAFIAGTQGMEQTWEHHLYGHWKFDEFSGDTAHDNSRNGFNAYTTGTFTTSGKWGNGLQLNGSQSTLIPHNISFNGTERFTVMAWIKVASFGSSSIVMSKHDGTYGWKLLGNATDQVTLQLDGTSFSGSTNIADNQWHHIAANFSFWENDVTIYVDGKVDAWYPGHYIVTTTPQNLIIGNGVDGTLDDVRYYGEHISESTFKSIYQLGFRSATGSYHLRADNNNTIHFIIDGGTTLHYFPSFTIENYWATTKPAAGCVVLNGTALIENSDYYAYIDDPRNTLKIILNRIISTDDIHVYIDESHADGYQMIGATKKMSWGVNQISTNKYYWVKNFPSDTLGNNSSNQWYINWNMSTATGPTHQHRDGEIWYMASSKEKPLTKIDTSSSSLIPGSSYSAYYATLGRIRLTNGSYHVQSSSDVDNTITAEFPESSSVRVRLRINGRQVVLNGSEYWVVTEWTIYPTGQFFRYDSIYQKNFIPDRFYMGWFMRDQTNATVYTNTPEKRAAIHYSSGYPDFAAAWLSFNNADGYQKQPFDSDTFRITKDEYRVGFDFYDEGLLPIWNSSFIETAQYLDIKTASMTSALVDSMGKSVQNIGLSGGAALAMIEGTLITTSTGDLDSNGFNERQGAYMLHADNNTVNFKIPARNDTCRFYPAFVIRNYYASRKPNYVFGYNASDTTVFLDGYQYNAYLNSAARELVIQFDSVFCDSAGIYISADKTLAVTISEFLALGGILSDTVRWQTESEQENLGFHIYRRIRPAFIDSIKNVIKYGPPQAALGRAGTLFKTSVIDTSDTQWVKITEKLIPGAPSGASVGPRHYQFIDFGVYDSLIYEYRLKAIDFENRNKIYGPVNAMPFALIKYLFRLGRNYPNPFRGYTIIHFTLPETMTFSLDIYDLQGRLVKHLIRKDKPYNAGMHRVIWDCTNSSGQKAAAGTYIYHLNSKKYKKAFTMLYIGR